MELITILDRCHRFPGFVCQHAQFSADKKSIEVAVRPRKGSTAVCSRCHLPAPGYDQLAQRRFEFIPLLGSLVFFLYTMRRVDCCRCGVVAVDEVPWGDGKRTLTKALRPVLSGNHFLSKWISSGMADHLNALLSSQTGLSIGNTRTNTQSLHPSPAPCASLSDPPESGGASHRGSSAET